MATKTATTNVAPGKRNRHKILQAAATTFAKQGYSATSVQMLADAAGLPKANLLYYFNSKKALYLEVLEDIRALWDSAFDQACVDDDPAQCLASYIREKMQFSRQRPATSRLFAREIINGGVNLDNDFEQQHKHWMEGRVAVINGWIEQAKMAPVQADVLLFQIWASTQHYADFDAQIRLLKGRPLNDDEFTQATEQLVHSILSGCGLKVPKEEKGDE